MRTLHRHAAALGVTLHVRVAMEHLGLDSSAARILVLRLSHDAPAAAVRSQRPDADEVFPDPRPVPTESTSGRTS